ncbi:hypothetical protein Zmor_005485 [Zophobas morio]|uniref:C2H2-type domain-containing protein n=1 Tax=Zophobas morio TaxID=2755281 RepID=A0AA38IXU8_9CUCU|nr:hypothetical protein Zmor_005485 [Zophobas morio]
MVHLDGGLPKIEVADSDSAQYTETWTCDLCPRTYKYKSNLTKHRSHHFEPKKPCPQCGKCFHDESSVKQHIFYVHSNKKDFVCHICDYATLTKYSLQLHIIRKHTKDYPLSCEICGKGYTKKHMLDAHRQSVHEGVEHACEECGKSFKYARGLQEHRKIHEFTPKKKEEIKCELCGEKFKYLKEHMLRVHGGVKTMICEACGKSFYTKTLLNIHMMRKHKNERPYKCSFCFHGLVTKSELKEHIKRRHSGNESIEVIREKPFQCSICGKRLKTSAFLTDHMRKHAGEKAYTCNVCEEKRLMLKRELKHFECGVCSQFFGSFDEYSFHVNNSHDELLTPDSGLLGIQFADIKSLIPKTDTEFIIDKSSDEEATEWDQIEVFTSKQPEKWSCDICNKILNSRTSFYRHRVGHSESKKPCPYCTGYFNRYTLKQHIQTIHLNKKNFVCDTCNYATVNKYFLEKHIIQQHTKTYPFPCNVCGRGFIKQSMLDDHHHREHREGVIHVCDECGKTFKTDASLRKHRKLHDPSLKKKEKPMCEICGEKFMYLQEHVRKMHGGTKSKMCEFCGKGFHTKNQLNMHMMRKHTGEKRFRCSFCFHGVVTKSELDEHIRRRHSDTESIEDVRDKPFQCSLCKKRFKIRGSLTDHMRKHSGEKAYSCDVCQEKFISKHYLKFHRTFFHVKERDNQRTYVCNTCSRAFGDFNLLVNHRQSHSKPAYTVVITTPTETKSNNDKTPEAETAYVCEFCSRIYKTESCYLKHRQYHLTPFTLDCKHCHYSAPTKSELLRHVTLKHTREKVYKCEVCSAGFISQALFDSHRRAKHENRRFQCDMCDKWYRYQSSLQVHQKTHDPNFIRKKFMCEICSKFERTEFELNIHLEMHKKKDEKHTTCRICGQIFATYYNLKLHRKIHPRYKCHVCEECGEQFSKKEDWKKHKETHESK